MNIIHADSQPLTIQGFKAICGKGGGVDKIDAVSNIEELSQKLSSEIPDLLVIDYDQPGFFSTQNLLEVRKSYPNLKILVISSDDSQDNILAVLESGVHGFLTRQCDEAETINAVFSIAKGDKFYCNKIVDILMERSFSPQPKNDCEPTSLTERETEVTILIAKAFTNKEIAEQLNLSVHTISTHRKNILRKLNVHSASALTRYAIHAGLLDVKS